MSGGRRVSGSRWLVSGGSHPPVGVGGLKAASRCPL